MIIWTYIERRTGEAFHASRDGLFHMKIWPANAPNGLDPSIRILRPLVWLHFRRSDDNYSSIYDT